MIVVQEYNPNWERQFSILADMIRKATWDDIVIEHVGSTSVRGLSAKPIIDIDVIVTREEVGSVIEGLSEIGYQHRGNLGIEDREAFYHPSNIDIQHHLYVCVDGSEAVCNHLTLRDYLRDHPKSARQYGNLKLKLAEEYPNDIDSYVAGKTGLITAFLSLAGMEEEKIASIREANRI